ncbi:MAG: LysR family transcriptional regulator substrate-binding protein [Geminicoccaceae bacterium]
MPRTVTRKKFLIRVTPPCIDHWSCHELQSRRLGPSVMVDFFSQLRRENPNLEIRIQEAEGHELVKALQDGEIDVGLIGLPRLPDDLRALPLYRERYTIAFTKGHPFERMNAVPTVELDGIDYLRI